jgi:hypothetical protein
MYAIVRVKPTMKYGKQQYTAGTYLVVTQAEVRSFGDKLEVIVEETDLSLPPLEEVVPATIAEALRAAGYDERAMYGAADETLLELPGLGPAALGKLRGAYGSVEQ